MKLLKPEKGTAMETVGTACHGACESLVMVIGLVPCNLLHDQSSCCGTAHFPALEM